MDLLRAGGAVALRQVSIELKATLLLEGPHLEEDAATVYAVVANLTLGMRAYSNVRKLEISRNGRKAMLALKLQFRGKAYIVSWSKAANSVVRAATFMGPTHQYTYNQHVSCFEDTYNDLELLGDPIQGHIKAHLLCESLQEEFMSGPTMMVQLSPETASKFLEAIVQLKSMRNMLISDRAGKERPATLQS
jgi:hypothetical protein